MYLISTLPLNTDYFRDGATYHSTWNRAVQARLLLTSLSDFSLGDTHLEGHRPVSGGRNGVYASCGPDAGHTKRNLFPVSQCSPRTRWSSGDNRDRGKVPIAHVTLGQIRPGQTVIAEEDIAILPSGPGVYSIQVRILANEIPSARPDHTSACTRCVEDHCATLLPPH